MSPFNQRKIAFFVQFSHEGYSGGRIHAFLMALALSYLGHKIDIFSNVLPKFLDDFSEYSCLKNIQWHLHDNFDFSLTNTIYDIVIVIPHRNKYFNLYLRAARVALRSNAYTIFINFESETWFNSLSPSKRDSNEWHDSYKFVKYSDLIISSTIESNKYAEIDYKTLFYQPYFDYCYPSINSIVANHYKNSPKKNQIVFISRWSDPHKKSNSILQILGEHLRGFEIIIIVGSGSVPSAFVQKIHEAARPWGMTVSILSQISEQEKFKIIAESRAMVFLSSFEGFGLPPVEALYCGTPCLCFDLPVLREVSGAALRYVPPGDDHQLRQELTAILQEAQAPDPDLRERVSWVARFENYAKRLDQLLTRFERRPRSLFCRYTRYLFYFIDRLHNVFAPNDYRSKRDYLSKSISFLNAYVLLKWQSLSSELPRKKIAVYGTQDYCIWLSNLTAKINSLDVTTILDDIPSNDVPKLWNRKPKLISDFDSSSVDAIILATECFQKKYKSHCLKLFGKQIRLIDLYENLPTGPYPKNL